MAFLPFIDVLDVLFHSRKRRILLPILFSLFFPFIAVVLSAASHENSFRPPALLLLLLFVA